jgi:flagellar motor protein MotB
MPLIRYFLVSGSLLLALLFISNAYLPKSDLTESEVVASKSDTPSIRIHSDRKAPELVVYDTTHPPVTTQQMAQTTAAQPTNTADNLTKTRILDAFAQLQPADVKPAPVSLNQPVSDVGKKAEVKASSKPQPKRKIARTQVGAPTMLVAQHQPQFGFFASDSW